MKVIDLISLLSSQTKILVRRAFGDDDDRQYFGLAQDYPISHCYSNRTILFIYPYHYDGEGDVPTIKEADSLDIAVSDFDEGEKFWPINEIGERIQEEIFI